MANQPETQSYDAGVYQLEIADSVDGGVGAKSNAPLLSLANRTAYLKKHLDDLEAGITVPAGFALLASPAFTGSPTAPTPAAGDNSTKLATTAFVQTTVNGTVSVSIAGAATTTLTQAQYGPAIIKLTGAVTADKAVVFPNISGHWQVINNSSGAFTVTLKTAAGSGVVLTNGLSTNIYCDGTNVTLQQTDFISPALTGIPTAPTAAATTSTTQIATTAFAYAAATAGGVSKNRDLRDTVFEKGIPSDVYGAGTVFGLARGGSDGLGIPFFGASSAIYGTLRVEIHWVDVSCRISYYRTFESSGRVFFQYAASASAWGTWQEFYHSGNLSDAFVSPTITGTPTAPTAPAGDNSTTLATTAFVQYAVNGVSSIAVSATGNTTVTVAQAGAGILNFTGALSGNVTVTLPAAVTGRWLVFNSTTGAFSLTLKNPTGGTIVLTQSRVAEVYSNGSLVLFAHTELSSPLLSGVPTAATAAPGTNTAQLATTAFVEAARVILAAADALKAPLASPALTGVPTAPTATAGTNTTQLATTAFVAAGLALKQDSLGFTPVQQGTGVGQTSNVVKIGWSAGAKLKATVDSTDLGNIALESYVSGAYAPLASPALTGNPTAPTPAQFDADTSVATTAFVQTSLGNRRLATSITVTRAITSGDFGGEFVVSAAGAITLTLPAASSVANGASIRLVNLGVGTCTLARTGADTFIGAFNSGGAATSFVLLPNDDVTVTQYGGIWLIIGVGAALSSTSGAIGFRYIGGGLIEQWGTVVGPANPANGRWELDITFPTAFPSVCLSVVGSAGISATDLDVSDGAGSTLRSNKSSWQVGYPLTNKFEAVVFYTDVPNNVRYFSWRAIGK